MLLRSCCLCQKFSHLAYCQECRSAIGRILQKMRLPRAPLVMIDAQLRNRDAENVNPSVMSLLKKHTHSHTGESCVEALSRIIRERQAFMDELDRRDVLAKQRSGGRRQAEVTAANAETVQPVGMDRNALLRDIKERVAQLQADLAALALQN